MGAYAYLAPQSVQEALSVLDDHLKRGERAQILSGGTDLLVQMRSVDKNTAFNSGHQTVGRSQSTGGH